jgi:hypothetical protein
MSHDREAEARADYEDFVRGMAEDARMVAQWNAEREAASGISRYSFSVERTPMGFVATLGDYDLEAPTGTGPTPTEAIIDWLEMWGDEMLGGAS